MAAELLSRTPIKKDTITKPNPLINKEVQITPKKEANTETNSSTEKLKQTITSYKELNKEKMSELYNTSAFEFMSIIDDIKNQANNNPELLQSIEDCVTSNGTRLPNKRPKDTKSQTEIDLFQNQSLIELAKVNQSPESIAKLSTSTKEALEYQNHLSKQIITIQSIINLASQKNITIDKTKITHFFDSYDKLEKLVTNSQQELAKLQEPYNGYTLGYHEMVTNPTKYITQNFRANPTYNTGDIISSVEEGADIKAIGVNAENKANSAISSVDGIAMVVAGPNFSILDTVSKIDSMSFYSPMTIPNKDKERLVELSYNLSYAAYQESLIKDYNDVDKSKIRKHEVIPQSYLDATNNLQLSKQGLTVYQNDANTIQTKIDEVQIIINQNQQKIDLLKAKTTKADTSAQKNITKLKKSNDTVIQDQKQLESELSTLNAIIEAKQQSIETLRIEAQSIYENYNPQGLAIPLALSPNGQIEVYQDGLKINHNPDLNQDNNNLQELENEYNNLLMKYKIRVNAIQIKINANVPRVKDAIANGKITGAIGLSQDYQAQSTTLQEAIAISLNIDDTSKTLTQKLKSTSVIRTTK